MDGKFVPVTAGAPTNDNTVPLATLLGKRPELAWPFNPAGGLLMVRPHGDPTLEQFLDLLDGASPPGCRPTSARAGAGGPRTPTAGGRVVVHFAARPAGGAALEGLHLKLRMLADAVESVRSLAEQPRHPMLNLEPDRFRVRLGQGGAGLPVLWTASAYLAEPGQAVELPVGDGTLASRTSCPPGRCRPRSTAPPRRAARPGACTLRFGRARTATAPEGGARVVLGGTLLTQERFAAGAPGSGPAAGGPEQPADRPVRPRRSVSRCRIGTREWAFRTIGTRGDEPGAGRPPCRRRAGAIADAEFEVLPALGMPLDLYSLGVLAARALLVNPRRRCRWRWRKCRTWPGRWPTSTTIRPRCGCGCGRCSSPTRLAGFAGAAPAGPGGAKAATGVRPAAGRRVVGRAGDAGADVPRRRPRQHLHRASPTPR